MASQISLSRRTTAVRISARYLHRIFQQHHPVSVASHIRTRRLNQARRDLADPSLGHLTIATLARRWGFPRPADFSRAFQRQTGAPPRDYRNSAWTWPSSGPPRPTAAEAAITRWTTVVTHPDELGWLREALHHRDETEDPDDELEPL